MTDIIIRVTIPESIKFKIFEGEVDGFEYVFITEQGTNRLLFDANTTLLRVRMRGLPDIEPEPEPEPPTYPPVIYAPYHVISALNVRIEPNTDDPAVTPPSPMPVNTNLELSTEIVDPNLLVRLGLPADLHIAPGYNWRAIKGGNFVATIVSGKPTVAEGFYANPIPPTTSPNLRVATINNKLGVAIKGTVRPVEGFVNIRPLAFCGVGNRVQGTSQADIVKLLDHTKNLGAKLIRFYTACEDFTPAENADRVKFVLDEMGRRGLYGILVLNDSLSSGFHVAGDRGYREGMPHGHLNYQYYIQNAYRGNYFQHVNTLLDRFGNHPAIASYDIMNETGGYGISPITVEVRNAIRAFGVATVQLIRSKSAHWINWGIINTPHIGANTQAEAEAFYRGLGLNVLGAHLYRENNDANWAQEDRAISDSIVAKKLGLPIWIDEIGVNYIGNNRQTDYRNAIERFKTWSAGFGYWGFNPLSAQMNLSDNLGVSVHLPDYNDLIPIIRSYM